MAPREVVIVHDEIEMERCDTRSGDGAAGSDPGGDVYQLRSV